MGLADRWYMQDRARLREAWRRHRPPERVVPFELVVRRRSGWRGWLLAGLGASMIAAALTLLWSGWTVVIDPAGMARWLRQALHELRVLACN